MRSHWAFRSALVAATALGLAVPATAFAQLHQDAWKTASIPPTTVPTIPPGDDIIVYLHGGPGSRLEESLDLVPKLHAAGLANGSPLRERLAPLGVVLSRIASGVPHGGDLEFAETLLLRVLSERVGDALGIAQTVLHCVARGLQDIERELFGRER